MPGSSGMSDSSFIDVDVLIVGAGPAGLATANYLGMNGVRVLVLERNAGTVDEPRAVSIDDESLRSLQTLGLDGQMTPLTLPGYGSRYYTPGKREFARTKPTTREFGHPRRSAFHQPEFESILLAGLEKHASVEVRFSHCFEGFKQDTDSVTAKVTDPAGTTLTVRAQFLAACDGGRSSIRKSLGIEMVGASFVERWLVFDCVDDPDDTPDSIAYCDYRRPAISLPGPNRTRRWEFLLKPDENADDFIEDKKIAELLSPYLEEDTQEVVRNIARRVVYTFHARVAETWQVGRVFLLGDAAHLTPPYAGQGMNSGQRDAANFAWKAAAIVKGLAGPALLRTYETERRDHAQALIRMAIQIGWIMVPRNWLHTYGQIAFFRIAGLIPKVRDYFLGMKFKPVPRFPAGFLVPDSLSVDDTLVGRMLPQPDVIDTNGIPGKLDDVLGPGFALLGINISPASSDTTLHHKLWDRLGVNRVELRSVTPSARPSGENVTAVGMNVDTLPARFSPYSGKILLVRPDRYVAAAFTAEDTETTASELSAMMA